MDVQEQIKQLASENIELRSQISDLKQKNDDIRSDVALLIQMLTQQRPATEASDGHFRSLRLDSLFKWYSADNDWRGVIGGGYGSTGLSSWLHLYGNNAHDSIRLNIDATNGPEIQLRKNGDIIHRIP
jgi:hypothetical protein